MKVIDLLNKMALDENYHPQKVIHRGVAYEYKTLCYYRDNESAGLFSSFQVDKILNDEVEVIDELKEIEPLVLLDYSHSPIDKFSLIEDKTNEIIQKVNGLQKVLIEHVQGLKPCTADER